MKLYVTEELMSCAKHSLAKSGPRWFVFATLIVGPPSAPYLYYPERYGDTVREQRKLADIRVSYTQETVIHAKTALNSEAQAWR